jgi:hypothetical protein
MVVIRKNSRGVFKLGELEGTVSRLCYGAFRLILYYPRRIINVSMSILDQEPLVEVLEDKNESHSNIEEGLEDEASKASGDDNR